MTIVVDRILVDPLIAYNVGKNGQLLLQWGQYGWNAHIVNQIKEYINSLVKGKNHIGYVIVAIHYFILLWMVYIVQTVGNGKRDISVGDLIRLGDKFVARCPHCNGQVFYLQLDGVGMEWDKILGFECVSCENVIEIKVIKEEL